MRTINWLSGLCLAFAMTLGCAEAPQPAAPAGGSSSGDAAAAEPDLGDAAAPESGSEAGSVAGEAIGAPE